MFETLQAQPARRKILALMAQYREDPRETKIDLGGRSLQGRNGADAGDEGD